MGIRRCPCRHGRGRGDTVIRVGGNLDLKASTIASETDKLDLKAKSLTFSD